MKYNDKSVIVAGHVCLDITPIFPTKKGNKVEEVLLPGKLLNMKEADVHTGGCVANTGLAMKFLGAKVSLVGKIGNDAFGTMIQTILNEYQAADHMIVDEAESTSYSVILAIPGIDRIFLHNPGANHTFCAADISQKKLEAAALLHFGYPPQMKSMYEKEGEELLALLKRAKKLGVATSLDMSAVDADSEAGLVNWRTVLEKIIPYIDFFLPSVEELCYMLDSERFRAWTHRAKGRDITEILNIEKDVIPLAEQCMKLGARVLVIKCGARGMYIKTADKDKLDSIGTKVELDSSDWADQAIFEKSYIPEQILSGTGAGDSSIAAFLTAMLRGHTIDDAMHLAAATGASCVAAYDALSGLKSLEELHQKIQQGWEKNK